MLSPPRRPCSRDALPLTRIRGVADAEASASALFGATVLALPLVLFACASDQAPWKTGSSSAGGGVPSGGSGSSSDTTGVGGGGGAGAGHASKTCPEKFSLVDRGYTTVDLETDYDMWTTAIPMAKNANDTWEVTTPVPRGKDVQYNFVADGNWLSDPTAPTVQLPADSGTNINNIAQAISCDEPAPASSSSSEAR